MLYKQQRKLRKIRELSKNTPFKQQILSFKSYWYLTKIQAQSHILEIKKDFFWIKKSCFGARSQRALKSHWLNVRAQA